MNSHPLKDFSHVDSRALVEESRGIIESVAKWNKSKRFTYDLTTGKKVLVQTYTETINNDYWCARDSPLDELGDEKRQVYQNLLKYVVGSPVAEKKTHTEHELNYVDEIYDYKIEPVELKNAAEGSITYKGQMFYKFQFPLKKRVFHVLVHIVKAKDLKEAFVITLALDQSLFENKAHGFVLARYTSIEKIAFDEETNQLVWSMATCSSPGGYIPDIVTKMGLPPAVAKDVPHFLNWTSTL